MSYSTVSGPGVWTGQDISSDPSWRIRFDANQIDEMRRAVDKWSADDVGFADIGPAQEALPSLLPMAEQIKQALSSRGFVLVSGVPVEGLTDAQAGTLFWAIGSLVGTGVTQNPTGDLLCPVTNRGVEFSYSSTGSQARGYQSKAELNFHCDPADVVALICLRKALKGGASVIASSQTVYNEFARNNPEYLDILLRGFHYDRKGENHPDESPVTQRIPVFKRHGGRVSSRYSRSSITSGATKVGTPLTERELDALNMFDEIAHREDVTLQMAFEPGDMQFLNNYTTVHGRTGFEDGPDPAKARFLYRLWLDLGDSAPWNEEDEVMRYDWTRYGNLGRNIEEWRKTKAA